MLNSVCYDILENIIIHLDIRSVFKLCRVSKSINKNLMNNRGYLQRILVNKMCTKLKIQMNVNNYSSYSYLLQIYKYFESKNTILHSDVIIYIIENGIATDILEQCLQHDAKLCYEDLEYILLFSSIEHFQVLASYIELSVVVLQNVLSQSLYFGDDSKCKVIMLHLLRKEYDSTVLTNICLDVIRQKKCNLLVFLIEQKRLLGLSFEYQVLLNSAIEIGNLNTVKMLYKEYLRDTNDPVIINTFPILSVCLNCKYDVLQFVIETFLEHYVNQQSYIDAICDGIKLSTKRIRLDNIRFLMRYLTFDNQRLICSLI